MSPKREWPLDTSPVVLELEDVRKAGVHAFMRPSAGERLPRLRTIGSRLGLEDSDKDGLYGLLLRLLGAGIAEMESEDDALAAEQLFALKSRQAVTLSERQSRAAAVYTDEHVTPNSFRQYREKPLVVALTRAIESLTPEKIARRTRISTSAGPPYIARNAPEATFFDLWNKGQLLVSFCGDAGTGKSSVARHVAQRISLVPDDYIELRAQTQQKLMAGIALALDQRGVDTAAHDAVLKEKFKRLLEEPGKIRVLLLDNVEERDVITELVPDNPRVTIIVTSRQDHLKDWRGETIYLGNMTADEAGAMAASRLRHLDHRDVQLLVEKLDYRPLAIAHACGYIRESKVDVDRFCALLDENIARVLDSIIDDEPTLTAIYRMTIEALDQQSLRMLELVVAFGGDLVPVNLIKVAWSGESLLRFDVQEDALADLEIDKAIRVLRRRSLVDTIEGPALEGKLEGEHCGVTIHTLTCKLIYSLREMQCTTIHRDLLELSKLPEERRQIDLVYSWKVAYGAPWEIGKTLSIRIAQRTPRLRFILDAMVTVSRIMLEQQAIPDIAMLAALVARGEAQNLPDAKDRMASISSAWMLCAESNSKWGSTFEGRQNQYALTQELVHYFELFSASATSSTLDKDLLHIYKRIREAGDGEIQTAKLLLANDFNPTLEVDALNYSSRAQDRDRVGLTSSAATHYFAAGTANFNFDHHAKSCTAYELAYDRWSILGRQYVGEMCQAAIRLVQVYRRRGMFSDAEAWRSRLLALAHDHIDRYGIGEWTYDIPTNVALYRAIYDVVRSPNLSLSRPANGDLFGSRRSFYRDLLSWIDDFMDTISSTALGPTLRYHKIIVDALLGIKPISRLINDLREIRQMMVSWGNVIGALRCELTMMKLKMIQREEGLITLHANDYEHVMHIAHSFYKKYKAAYWSVNAYYWRADTVLAAYILRVRYGCGHSRGGQTPEDFSYGVHKMLGFVGRQDWQAIWQKAKVAEFNPRWLLLSE